MKCKVTVIFLIVLLGLGAAGFADKLSAAGALQLDYQTIRQDRYPVPAETWQWGEAWGDTRQYFPRYFKPSATVHVFFRNNGKRPVEITQLTYDGQPIEKVTTVPKYAGPVIWHRFNPEVIQPGQMGMVYVRLRHKPTKPINITITTKDGQTLSVRLAETDSEPIRLGYVGFSKAIDKIYVYVDKYTDSKLSVDKVYLDGNDVTADSHIVNRSFKDNNPAYVEISLAKPLVYGSFHCIKVITHQGPVAMHQVRARDDRFFTMMFTGKTGLKGLWAKFFNAKYNIHGSHPKEPNWWDPNSDLAKLGFTWFTSSSQEAAITAGKTAPPGRIMYNSMDEPDAHEAWVGLPFQEVSGTRCMDVEKRMRIQRQDPYHETTMMIDRTFAPMNWLHYGELPDIFMHAIYTPTQWHGYDMQVFIHEMDAITAAAEPRPVHNVLWGLLATGYPMRRSLTPEENDMAVHYLIGGGARGVSYFTDWDSYPDQIEGGYFVATSRCKMFWKNIGRMNAEMTRLGSLLAIGHRFNIVETDDEKLWARSLLCGKDNFIIVLVNRKHRIHVGDRLTRMPHIFDIKDATVTMKLPEWFKLKSAVQVTWDSVEPVKLSGFGSTRKLHIDQMRTSKVLVLSQDTNIKDKLQLDPKRFAALLKSEKPTYVTDKPPIKDTKRPRAVISLNATAVEKGEITLDLTDFTTLTKAMRITTDGQLRLEPGKWLGLFTAPNWHGLSKIVFRIKSAVPLKKIDAKLYSQTPNFAACAHNIVGLSLDDDRYAETSSFRSDWNGGARGGEHLAVSKEAGENETIKTFYVRVQMRDPGIVASDEATNLAKKLVISWTK